jgi:hypothetical protein
VLDKEELPEGCGIGLRDGGDGQIEQDVVGFRVRAESILIKFEKTKQYQNCGCLHFFFTDG